MASKSGADDVRASESRIPWLRRALVVSGVIGVLCFANTLPNDYCYDDVLIVRDDPRVTEPGLWPAVFTKDHWAERADGWENRDLLYRPITLASYRLVHGLCGPNPFWQHLVNVVLHGVVCTLVALVCLRLGGSRLSCAASGSEAPRGLKPAARGDSAFGDSGGSNAAALVGGVAFAVLPIHTEAVASVVGRADLLAAVGVLAAALAHGRSVEAQRDTRRWTWRLGALCACFIAIAAKENGLAVVGVLVLCDAYWHHRRFADRVANRGSWWNISTLGRLAYVAVPLVGYVAARLYVLGGRFAQAPPETKTVNVLVDAGVWQHVLGVVQLWGMYWAKTFWPAVLTIKYSINGLRLATSPTDGHVVFGLLVVGALLACSAYAWRRGDRRMALLAALLVICYAPTSNAVVLMQVFLAERVWYLPSVWLCLMLGLLLGIRVKQSVVATALVVLAFGMLARCYVRNTEWRSNETLYAAAWHDAPDSVGPLQLYGGLLVRQGRLEEGLPLLHRAIEIDLGLTDAHRSLGRAYLKLGDYASAVRHLQYADMQSPGHASTQAALADASMRLAEGRGGELARLRAAADAEPANRDVALAWVRALRDVGRLDEAMAFQLARDGTFADDAAWQYEFAVTLVLHNDRDQAIERYRKSLVLEPDEPQRIIELAMLLLERRGREDVDESARLAERAGRLAPRAPVVLACRAEVAVARGETAVAASLLRRAALALPEGHPQRRIFVERARALGDVRD